MPDRYFKDRVYLREESPAKEKSSWLQKNPCWHHWSKYAFRLGRDAHIPALRALPGFEITAVSTSRQETADETAQHFAFPTLLPTPSAFHKPACTRFVIAAIADGNSPG